MLSLKANNHEEDEDLKGGTPYQESYIKLSANRTIVINEDITKKTAADLSALLLYYDNKSEDDINILINSNGGDASALTAMYDVMHLITADIKTICLGKCYSAAAVLLAAGTKGKRYAYKNSQIMIHGIQCSFPIMGESDENKSENYFNFLNYSNDKIMEILAAHTGKTMQQISEDCKRDLYLSAPQALKYGIIDRII